MNNRILHAVDEYRAKHYTAKEAEQPSGAAFFPSDVREILNSYCTPAAAITAALEAGYEIGTRQKEKELSRIFTRNEDLSRQDLQTIKALLQLSDLELNTLFFAD